MGRLTPEDYAREYVAGVDRLVSLRETVSVRCLYTD